MSNHYKYMSILINPHAYLSPPLLRKAFRLLSGLVFFLPRPFLLVQAQAVALRSALGFIYFLQAKKL